MNLNRNITIDLDDMAQAAWDSESRNSPYSTVADAEAEDYCEGCDADVVNGRCACPPEVQA